MSFFSGEGRSCSLQPSGLQVPQHLLEHGQENPVLPLVRQFRDVLNAQDEATPVDLDLARLHLQRGQDLEIRSEGRGKIRVAPQPRKEATAEFAGNPVSGGQVVGPLVAAGVADDDVLVIGERPDVGFLGRQCLLTEVGRHTDLSWIGIP